MIFHLVPYFSMYLKAQLKCSVKTIKGAVSRICKMCTNVHMKMNKDQEIVVLVHVRDKYTLSE